MYFSSISTGEFKNVFSKRFGNTLIEQQKKIIITKKTCINLHAHYNHVFAEYLTSSQIIFSLMDNLHSFLICNVKIGVQRIL